jgi:hypothetical protein
MEVVLTCTHDLSCDLGMPYVEELKSTSKLDCGEVISKIVGK